MQFEWDEQKRLSNLAKHGLDFWDVWQVFESAHLVVPSTYGGDEDRFLAIGLCEGRCVTAVYTLRSETVRVISFRRARDEERQRYHEAYSGGA